MGLMGIREAACRKWPKRRGGEKNVQKKLNREITMGTGGQEGQKVN